RWAPELLVPGAAPAGHMHPDRGAFALAPSASAGVGDRRVLLLDDTYVSGARAQSAAAALRRAGARAAVIVVAGRVLRPDRIRSHAAFLGAGGALRCRSCGQTGAGTE
ncbi:MAG TPA: hypothetical protein VHD39_01935, partial [Acidimicrobiales bacterium]|nr:hypothetical protein [Acidimicrobiales bacterium]